jgi:ABC-2 type transport system permease protein
MTLASPPHACSAATTKPYRSSLRTARVTFPRLVQAEWVALFSLRSTYITLVVGGFLAFALAAYTASSWAGETASAPFTDTPSQGTMFAQIAAVLVGAALYARENTTGSLRTQFAAAPRRVSILLAKATALFVAAFVLGAILVALILTASAILYSGAARDVDLDPTTLASLVVGGGALLALTSVLGLGIATIVRSEALTITIVLVVLLVLPMLLTLAEPNLPWAVTVSDLMFGNASSVLLTPITELSATVARNLTTVIAWPTVALALGTLLVARRDA